MSANLFEIHVVAQLHILGVNAKNLEPSHSVRNADVNLTVETAEATKGRVNAVRAVCRRNDNNVRPLLETIHKSEQLRNNTALDLTVCLNRIS